MKLNKVKKAQFAEKMSWILVGLGLAIFTEYLGIDYATAFFGLLVAGMGYVSAVTNMKDGVVA